MLQNSNSGIIRTALSGRCALENAELSRGIERNVCIYVVASEWQQGRDATFWLSVDADNQEELKAHSFMKPNHNKNVDVDEKQRKKSNPIALLKKIAGKLFEPKVSLDFLSDVFTTSTARRRRSRFTITTCIALRPAISCS